MLKYFVRRWSRLYQRQTYYQSNKECCQRFVPVGAKTQTRMAIVLRESRLVWYYFEELSDSQLTDYYFREMSESRGVGSDFYSTSFSLYTINLLLDLSTVLCIYYRCSYSSLIPTHSWKQSDKSYPGLKLRVIHS